MKKLISVILCLLLALSALSGCASPAPSEKAAEGKLSIVATIYPIYDWVLQILGDRADQAQVTLLMDGGVDLHSFQPSVDDIVRISTCDLFLYVGGESDDWAEAALKEATNKNMLSISLMGTLGDSVKEEEIVEGMEHDHDHDEEHEDHDDGHDHDEPEYDEHVWLSLKNAAVLCRAIAAALGQIDEEHRAAYAANADAYIEKLDGLDGQYRAAVEASGHRTLLFGDRFPFRYLTDDYGLGYYAAFVGCSAETEASFETVVFLANKLDELGLPAILQIEGSDGSIARTILENAKSENLSILTLDSMQSVTAQTGAARGGYLGIMEKNLEVLKAALG